MSDQPISLDSVRVADDEPSVRRYAETICRMHQRLRYHRLAEELRGRDGVHIVERHGVTTVVARTGDIGHRYLLGIAGFRLAQYVRLGYVNTAKAATDALFCEPLATIDVNDWHVVCLDSATGAILGYVELASNGGPAAPVRATADRPLFPVEQTHGIDIFDVVDAPADLSTDQVREVKRMVHNGALDDRRTRYRVSIELILGLQWVFVNATPRVRVIIGDAEAHLTLRHLVAGGVSPIVITGTAPRLPLGHLLQPSYQVRSLVEPFYGVVPEPQELARRRAVAELVVSDANVLANLRLLLKPDMRSPVTRIGVARAQAG
jgi:hypothetical protein